MVLGSTLSGCEEEADPTDYIDRVRSDRGAKDRMMRGETSPLPPEERTRFAGLRYYPPDPSFRVTATFHPAGEPRDITLSTSTGEEREMTMVGLITFARPGVDVRGEPLELELFRSAPADGGGWFLPFADGTNGETTYGAGRYLDIDGPDEENRLTLDFNYAYNPYCAYNPGYSCPLVPTGNVLPVRIEAGERMPNDGD